MNYSIGLDFGTLSVRALLVDVSDGSEIAASVSEYACGVITGVLRGGSPLPEGYALANPPDYLSAMKNAVEGVLRESGINARDIVGIGIDATSSSTLPTDGEGSPLSLRFPAHPHAYLKLWKHHGAYEQALYLQKAARQRKEAWLPYYGNGVYCELFLPKALETAMADPEVWKACACYLELGDWIVWRLTGRLTRSVSIAGCNSFWRETPGWPDEALFSAAAPGTGPVTQKLGGDMLCLGQAAGGLTASMAAELGLYEGTPVAAAMIDSHASVSGCGASRPGDLTAVLGTSACYLLNALQERPVQGISASAYETLSCGLYGYEGGQSCVGDALDWFLRSCVPGRLEAEAAEKGIGLHALLSQKASALPLGSGGVRALDWLNGARSPQRDPNLRGVFAGLSLQSGTPAMYRALLEALCCGARRVIECYAAAGLPVTRLFATGGIPHKNAFFMQLLSDVLGMEIRVSQSGQTSALGSAIMGAAAGGRYGGVRECIARMASPVRTVYRPGVRKADADALYRDYLRLAEKFENG